MSVDFGNSLTRDQVDGPGDDPAQARAQLDAIIARLNDKLVNVTILTASDKTGNDAGIVSGTAGTNGNLGQWNADGDLVDGPDVLDEDDMASDSASAVATQQSTKAYVDSGDRVVELASDTLSSSQSEITLNQDFSPYSAIEIQFFAFLPVNDGVSLEVFLSTDSGSSYVTGYDVDVWYSGNGTALTELAINSSNDLSLMPTVNITQGNGSNEHLRGRIVFYDLNTSGVQPGAESEIIFRDTGGAIFRVSGAYIRESQNEDYNGIKISYNSGNIAAGSKYVIRGWK